MLREMIHLLNELDDADSLTLTVSHRPHAVRVSIRKVQGKSERVLTASFDAEEIHAVRVPSLLLDEIIREWKWKAAKDRSLKP
jgi:hypothetical protein